MRPAWHVRTSKVLLAGPLEELWPSAIHGRQTWTRSMTLAHAHSAPPCRHADEVLSKTEQHIQQIKDLPPEVKETMQKEGFQDPHAPRQQAQRAEE